MDKYSAVVLRLLVRRDVRKELPITPTLIVKDEYQPIHGKVGELIISSDSKKKY